MTNSTLPSIHDKPVYVQGMFNRIAGRYDLMNNVISMGMHWGWKRQAVEAMNLYKGDHALDVCSGTGDLLSLIQNHTTQNGQVTALDFSEEMLGVAQDRYADATDINFIQGDAMALPFEANQFHASVVAFGLRNVANIDTAVGEMVRVTRPRGRVVNLDTAPIAQLPGFKAYFKYVMPRIGQVLAGDEEAYKYLQASTENFVSPEEMKGIFEGQGLINVTIQRVGFGSAAIVFGTVPE